MGNVLTSPLRTTSLSPSNRNTRFELRSVAALNLKVVCFFIFRVELFGPPFDMIVKNHHDVECRLLVDLAVRSK